jgi:hypothetical protein
VFLPIYSSKSASPFSPFARSLVELHQYLSDVISDTYNMTEFLKDVGDVRFLFCLEREGGVKKSE